MVQRVQREHHVAASFRFAQGLAGVGDTEAQRVIQAGLFA